MESTKTHSYQSTARTDIYQQVTDSIIQQLEAGTVPWLKPWQDDNGISFAMPQNSVTGKQYQGINIVLLWTAVNKNGFSSHEWASFKQWSAKKESIRKGEKGTLIVYYDTLEKEVEGELKNIPFIKSSYVFNRSQLQSYQPQPVSEPQPFGDRLPAIDRFIENTGACIEHEDYGACYLPLLDKI